MTQPLRSKPISKRDRRDIDILALADLGWPMREIAKFLQVSIQVVETVIVESGEKL